MKSKSNDQRRVTSFSREIKGLQDAITAERCRKVEVDLAVTADLGTLQRLPGNRGGMRMHSKSALDEAHEGVYAVAEGIAMKSQLTVIGTKE
ncbi:hypothetical protein MKW98_028173, partial [Papaver atlanticum]